jgi:hypothetical protein
MKRTSASFEIDGVMNKRQKSIVGSCGMQGADSGNSSQVMMSSARSRLGLAITLRNVVIVQIPTHDQLNQMRISSTTRSLWTAFLQVREAEKVLKRCVSTPD